MDLAKSSSMIRYRPKGTDNLSLRNVNARSHMYMYIFSYVYIYIHIHLYILVHILYCMCILYLPMDVYKSIDMSHIYVKHIALALFAFFKTLEGIVRRKVR